MKTFYFSSIIWGHFSPTFFLWVVGGKAWEKYGWRINMAPSLLWLQKQDHKSDSSDSEGFSPRMNFPCEIWSAVNTMHVVGVLTMTFLPACWLVTTDFKLSSSIMEITLSIELASSAGGRNLQPIWQAQCSSTQFLDTWLPFTQLLVGFVFIPQRGIRQHIPPLEWLWKYLRRFGGTVCVCLC